MMLPGINGGPSGDLFLHINFEKHPDYRVVGSDLSYDFALASLGVVCLASAVAPAETPRE